MNKNQNQKDEFKKEYYYEWKTYEDIFKLSRSISTGLQNLFHKIEKKEKIEISEKEAKKNSNKKMVGIFAENSMEWFLIDFACIFGSIISVPIHNNFSSKQLSFIISQTNLNILFVSFDNLDKTLLVSSLLSHDNNNKNNKNDFNNNNNNNNDNKNDINNNNDIDNTNYQKNNEDNNLFNDYMNEKDDIEEENDNEKNEFTENNNSYNNNNNNNNLNNKNENNNDNKNKKYKRKEIIIIIIDKNLSNVEKLNKLNKFNCNNNKNNNKIKIKIKSLNELIELDERKWYPLKFDQKENEMTTLIYTSGSTGMPKGSIITNQLLNDPFAVILPFFFTLHFQISFLFGFFLFNFLFNFI